jgi:hypothetical protein
MAKYKGTLSSGDKIVSTANQVFDFFSPIYPFGNCSVQYLSIQTYDKPLHIKLNNESTVHFIDINSEFIMNDISIDKMTIVDAGVTFYYTALTTG